MNEFRKIVRPTYAHWILLFVIVVIFGDCASSPKTFGINRLSDETDRAFESFQVLPDHSYYYCGSNVEPDAILAIHKNYVLTSADLWTKTAPEGKQLKYWVEVMQKSVVNRPHGYLLLTPDGKQIGVIYTRWNPGSIEMGAGNQVSVYLPDKWADERPKPLFMRRP